MLKVTPDQFDALSAHMHTVTTREVVPGAMFASNNKRTYTVIDKLTTTNLKGEVVKVEYLAEHKFAGQMVKSRHGATEVLRGLLTSDDAVKYLLTR